MRESGERESRVRERDMRERERERQQGQRERRHIRTPSDTQSGGAPRIQG